jgi:5-methylcytosine-specific restriction endonuclease McrA
MSDKYKNNDEYRSGVIERAKNNYQSIKYDIKYKTKANKRSHDFYYNVIKQNKEYYMNILKKRREWNKNNKDKLRIRSAKYRHKKLDSLVLLTQEEKQCVSDIFAKARKLGPDWHVDHIIPVSRGGTWHPDNLQIVLKSYNLKKNNKLESEFRPPLDCEIYKL